MHGAQVEEYEEALLLAVHGNVVEAKEKLQQLLEKPPLLLLMGAVGSAPASAGARAAGGNRPQSSTFLQLRYLSLNNLAALEGDDHRRVRAFMAAAWLRPSMSASEAEKGGHSVTVLSLNHTRRP